MSAKKPVVVYGVSGYTGRLVCEYLRELNVPFVAVIGDTELADNTVALKNMISGEQETLPRSEVAQSVKEVR